MAKEFGFTVKFVTTFTDEEYAKVSLTVPDTVLAEVAKRGLIDLMQPRMQELNEGATKITVAIAE
jgi:hypothetical protein